MSPVAVWETRTYHTSITGAESRSSNYSRTFISHLSNFARLCLHGSSIMSNVRHCHVFSVSRVFCFESLFRLFVLVRFPSCAKVRNRAVGFTMTISMLDLSLDSPLSNKGRFSNKLSNAEDFHVRLGFLAPGKITLTRTLRSSTRTCISLGAVKLGEIIKVPAETGQNGQ